MSYASYTKKKWLTLQIDEVPACSKYWPYNNWYDDLRVVVSSADKQTRTRPKKEELWKNQTALPLQYRQKSQLGHAYEPQTVVSTSYWCPGIGYTTYYRRRMFHVDPGQTIWGTWPETNWQLDMRLKLKDHIVNLGSALAEYRETATMFKRTATTLWEIYKGVKKRRIKNFCDIAATHLMYDFGIRPLMGDLESLVSSLGFRLSQGNIVMRHVVTKKAKDSGTTAQFSYEIEQSDRAIVYAEVSPEKLYDISTGNAGEIAWEIVPFSFVVDWMIPVGDWLSSLDALKYVGSLTGTLTTKRKYRHEALASMYEPNSSILNKDYFSYASHQRSLLTTIPIPALLRYEPSRSLRNVLQGMSLLTVLNKRCKKR